MSEESSEEYLPSIASDVSQHYATTGKTSRAVVENVSNSRKRKASVTDAKGSNKDRCRAKYLPRYHELFNSVVEDLAITSAASANLPLWDDTRIGLSRWSSIEKDAFFLALDRKGQDDVRGISRAIVTKSEVEVNAFILALKAGYIEEHQESERVALADHSEFPAAVEISTECEQALEIAAHGLSERQRIVDEELERGRHGDFWLLNSESATDVLASPTSDVGSLAIIDLDSATHVLDLTAFIELSTRFFMNSKTTESNWRNYDEEESGPGIHATAFLDLYRLLIGITKRAVSSALFLAASRHRSQNEKLGRDTRAIVKTRDVQAACELLGLTGNRRTLGIGLARRCKVDVYQQPVYTYTSQRPLSYDEVERVLRLGVDDVATRSGNDSSADESDVVRSEDIALIHDGNYLADEETEQRIDLRAELADSIASQQEEARLWTLLDETTEAPAIIKHEEDEPIPQSIRQRDLSGFHWREKLRFLPEWQLENGIPPRDALNSHKRRRGLQNDHGQPSPQTVTDGLISDTMATTRGRVPDAQPSTWSSDLDSRTDEEPQP